MSYLLDPNTPQPAGKRHDGDGVRTLEPDGKRRLLKTSIAVSVDGAIGLD